MPSRGSIAVLTLRKLDRCANQKRQHVVRSSVDSSTIRIDVFCERELLFLRLSREQRLDGADDACDGKLKSYVNPRERAKKKVGSLTLPTSSKTLALMWCCRSSICSFTLASRFIAWDGSTSRNKKLWARSVLKGRA
jgi:hypothetical protein